MFLFGFRSLGDNLLHATGPFLVLVAQRRVAREPPCSAVPKVLTQKSGGGRDAEQLAENGADLLEVIGLQHEARHPQCAARVDVFLSQVPGGHHDWKQRQYFAHRLHQMKAGGPYSASVRSSAAVSMTSTARSPDRERRTFCTGAPSLCILDHRNRRLLRVSWPMVLQPISFMPRSSSARIRPSARSTPA